MLKAAELRDMTNEELTEKINKIKKELYDLQYQLGMGRVDKPHRISQTRREIARIKTILNERSKKA